MHAGSLRVSAGFSRTVAADVLHTGKGMVSNSKKERQKTRPLCFQQSILTLCGFKKFQKTWFARDDLALCTRTAAAAAAWRLLLIIIRKDLLTSKRTEDWGQPCLAHQSAYCYRDDKTFIFIVKVRVMSNWSNELKRISIPGNIGR